MNDRPRKEPLEIEAEVGRIVILDAAGTKDPDGPRVDLHMVFLPRGRHRHPKSARVRGGPCTDRRGRDRNEGGIPSAPQGLREPEPRVVLKAPNRARTEVLPRVAGTAHVILAVEDNGTPPLTSYRRVILRIRPAPAPDNSLKLKLGIVTPPRRTPSSRP